MKNMLKSALLCVVLACCTSSIYAATGKMTPPKSPSVVGKWKGNLNGKSGKIIGKAYIGRKDTTSVLHTWAGSRQQNHCRYRLRRIETLKDRSVIYKEGSTSRSCKPLMVKVKRVGLKYVELTRFDPTTNQDVWKGEMRMKKRLKSKHRSRSSSINIPLIGKVKY